MSNNNDTNDYSKQNIKSNPNKTVNREQLKSHFIRLKEEMKNACNLIEETIQINKNNSLSVKPNSAEQREKYMSNDYLAIQQMISYYKDKINAINAKLAGFYNLSRIEKLEQDIKMKNETALNLRTENNALLDIHKNQSKALNLYQERYENKTEIEALEDKLKALKEEYKKTKDLQTTSEVKSKSQNAKINQLAEKCKIIKENIEYKKKQNMKEVLLTQNQIDNQDVLQLEEQLKFSEMQMSTQERNYNKEISRQQGTISRLKEEFQIISIQLKEKEQEIRIYELKMKELRKIQQSNELIKMKSQQMKFQHTPVPNENNNKEAVDQLNIREEKDEMLIQIDALKQDIQRTLMSNDIKVCNHDGYSDQHFTSNPCDLEKIGSKIDDGKRDVSSYNDKIKDISRPNAIEEKRKPFEPFSFGRNESRSDDNSTIDYIK